jgi:prepilin-type N-terminal cleavage/methylation domain-containing protein
MRRKAFTLLELLVVIGIIGILVGILGPQLGKVMKQARLTRCKTNLKAIGTGVVTYKSANKEKTPVMRSKPTTDADVNAAPTTGSDDKYGVSTTEDDGTGTGTNVTTKEDWSDLGDSAMQSVWLMIASASTKEKAFECPSDTEYEKRGTEYKFGWTSPFQYSYGLQWPYQYSASDVRNQAAFTATLENVIVFADANPCPEGSNVGIDDGMADGPIMHEELGINVLWAGGSVETYDGEGDGDSLAGYGNDDIYLGGPAGTGVSGAMPESVAGNTDYDATTDTSITSSGRLGSIAGD